MNYTLTDVHRVDSFGEIKGDLSITKGVFSYGQKKAPLHVNVGENYFLYPSLINSFENLSHSYSPRFSKSNYTSYNSLKEELSHSLIKKERDLFIDNEIYLLGCLKNILCGCTHLYNENNLFNISPEITGNFPISFLEKENEGSTKSFFVEKIAQDYTSNPNQELEKLLKNKRLTPNTLLFGGLTLNKESDLQIIKKSGASIIWTPCAQKNIFDDIAPINIWLNAEIPICLGTDSSFFGGTNLLEEIKIAYYLYEKHFHQTLTAQNIFNMLTINPAKAFNIKSGNLKEGSNADFIITNKIKKNPFINILHLQNADINLVVKNGKPLYGDIKFLSLFKKLGIRYILIEMENETKILAVRGYGILLKKISSILSYNKNFAFMPIKIVS